MRTVCAQYVLGLDSLITCILYYGTAIIRICGNSILSESTLCIKVRVCDVGGWMGGDGGEVVVYEACWRRMTMGVHIRTCCTSLADFIVDIESLMKRSCGLYSNILALQDSLAADQLFRVTSSCSNLSMPTLFPKLMSLFVAVYLLFLEPDLSWEE